MILTAKDCEQIRSTTVLAQDTETGQRLDMIIQGVNKDGSPDIIFCIYGPKGWVNNRRNFIEAIKIFNEVIEIL